MATREKWTPEKRLMMQRAAASVREAPSVAVGAGLYIALTVIAFQYPELATAETLAVPAFASIMPSLSNAVAFAAIGVAYAVRRIKVTGSPRLLATAATMVVMGTLTVSVLAVDLGSLSLRTIACFIGYMLVGGGSALLGVSWIDELAKLPTVKAVAAILTAAPVAALCILFALLTSSWLPPSLASTLYVIVSCVLLGRLHGNGRKQVATKEGGASLSIPWKLIATIFFQGFSVGAVHRVLTHGAGNVLVMETAALLSAAILVAVAVFAFRIDYGHLLYMIGFPLIALGQVAVVLFARNLEVVIVHEIGYRLVMIASWMLAAHIIRAHGIAASWVWSCIMVGFVFGRLTGFVLEAAGPALFAADSQAVISVLSVFLVLFSALLLFDRTNTSDTWGMVKAVELESAHGASPAERACAAVAADFALSPREEEILVLLARGRSGDYIANHLTVSLETVRTHRRNIYRKLGVHSQQELMTFVEYRTEEQEK